MKITRVVVAAIGIGVAPLLITACGSEHSTESHSPSSQHSESHAPDPTAPDKKTWHSPAKPGDGYWDDQGQPVNGGPPGADGSTGNNLTKEYCAQNEDPACPAGSYVGPNAILDPAGGNDYVPCEGTICTNPNHGAGDDAECEGTVCTNPNHGAGDDAECEGTVCTNPNHGAGDDAENPAPVDNSDNG